MRRRIEAALALSFGSRNDRRPPTRGIRPGTTAPGVGLRGRIEAGTLAHALLIHGPRGVGRRALAGRIAARLLCRSPDAEGEACGHCHGCRLRRTGAHPDYHVVEVTEGRTRIRVGQIRELTEFANLSSQYGEHRVIALPEADRMNTEAANARTQDAGGATGARGDPAGLRTAHGAAGDRPQPCHRIA
ncbi:MAG: hypothetical protein U5L11_06735 [Arhodomonas sp.]|nr:hypothetical protein [Arhodomonas sp.]